MKLLLLLLRRGCLFKIFKGQFDIDEVEYKRKCAIVK
jgi:hypothetical protein